MSPLRLLTLGLVSGLGCLLAVGVAAGMTERPAVPAAASRVEPRVEPLAVLRAWDRAREAAWRRGSADALGRLYLPGSAAGRADRAMLREYAERGLRVTRLDVQRAAVEVLAARPGELVLAVTDRVRAATAVGDGVRLRLPADRWSAWRLELLRWEGRWVVSDVRAAGRPPPPR